MLPAVRQIPENLCGHSRRRPDCIYAKVEVTIQNGEITGIRILEHKNEHGQAAEAVVDRIVAEQRIDVDAVSGATNSSTVLKKAVENALNND